MPTVTSWPVLHNYKSCTSIASHMFPTLTNRQLRHMPPSLNQCHTLLTENMSSWWTSELRVTRRWSCDRIKGNIHVFMWKQYMFRLSIFFQLLRNFKGHYIVIADGRGRAGLRQLACGNFGFKSRRGHGCLSLVSAACCQVEVSASGWSLVQRNPIESGVSECDRKSSIMRRTWPNGGCCSRGGGRWRVSD